MTIKLYSIPPSVYSAKVRIVLRAKGVAFEDVPPPGGYGSDAYKALVPYGTMPAIEDGDFQLADSEAINEYLNERYPDPPMWPVEIEARARARGLSRFHDTRLEPSIRALFPHVAPQRRDGDFVRSQVPVIVERLEQLVRISDPAPLMTGNRLSLADCGYAVTLEMLSQLNEPMDLQILIPEPVARYIAALRDEPVVAAELSTYRLALSAWLEATLAN